MIREDLLQKIQMLLITSKQMNQTTLVVSKLLLPVLTHRTTVRAIVKCLQEKVYQQFLIPA